jgi:putative transposase
MSFREGQLTLRGLVTYYVLFFIHLDSRKVEIAEMTPHPNAAWMTQIARNVTMDEWGFLGHCRYLIHDRDTKYCRSFRDVIESGDIKTLRLPARSPTTISNRCGDPTIYTRERLGGLLRYYHLEAA